MSICFFAAVALVCSAHAVDLAKLARTDIRVAYLYEEKERIDWPLIFYFNEDRGYRVDLIHIGLRDKFTTTDVGLNDRQLFLHHVLLPAIAPSYFDSSWHHIFIDRQPDIVIIGETPGSLLYEAYAGHIVKQPVDSSRLFAIRQVFRLVGQPVSDSSAARTVSFNRQELVTKFRDQMRTEIPELLPGIDFNSYKWEQLGRYQVVPRGTVEQTPSDFASGIPPLRLEQIFAKQMSAGPMRESYLKRIASFVRNMDLAVESDGKEQVHYTLNGYKDLLFLSKEHGALAPLEKFPDFRPYVDDLLNKAERAALQQIGLSWDGEISIRPSPEGPKLKFRAALSANGPEAIELNRISFHPYWDTTTMVMDSTLHQIAPHSSFVQEYLVDIDRARLEAQKPDSLIFTTLVHCDEIELELHSSLPVGEKPDLGISFSPDFLFMPQVTRTEADQIIHPLSLHVQITKPQSFTGNAAINLETPAGMFAGAYKQSIQLDKGTTVEYVQIPFSVSNLFELGIHYANVSLTVNGTKVATDSVRLRIAECRIPTTRKIAFLSDTTGRLEDILNMTDAVIEPLTDRALINGELRGYDALVIGSGAQRLYPSLAKVKDRLEEFLSGGGTIIILGQPENFPDAVLPVTISPSTLLLDKDAILKKQADSKLLTSLYPITEQDLLSAFFKRREVAAAVISPAQPVYTGPNGEALLSVSKFGKGEIIYCGLPLLEMISTLQIDAIHLFANIMNY